MWLKRLTIRKEQAKVGLLLTEIDPTCKRLDIEETSFSTCNSYCQRSNRVPLRGSSGEVGARALSDIIPQGAREANLCSRDRHLVNVGPARKDSLARLARSPAHTGLGTIVAGVPDFRKYIVLLLRFRTILYKEIRL